MATFVDLIVSRQKSIDVIVAEVAVYRDRAEKLGLTSAAGQALTSLVKVKETRLKKLREELAGFRAAMALDQAQLEVPGAGSSTSSEPPAPGPVTGRGRR